MQKREELVVPIEELLRIQKLEYIVVFFTDKQRPEYTVPKPNSYTNGKVDVYKVERRARRAAVIVPVVESRRSSLVTARLVCVVTGGLRESRAP